MLPFVVLRRFDCVLAWTKDKVVAEYEKLKGGKIAGDALDPGSIRSQARSSASTTTRPSLSTS
jgi:hypothetical protein